MFGVDKLEYKFEENKPIYIQLVKQFKLDIISGHYKLGEKIPSIRELALEINVNPNTIQRSLIELEDEGLIHTKRTSGKYVTRDYKIIEKIKKELAEEQLTNFITEMEKLGFDTPKSIELLKERNK